MSSVCMSVLRGWGWEGGVWRHHGQDMGTPSPRDRAGYPSFPSPPPPPRTGYSRGGMPLAVTQEDFLVCRNYFQVSSVLSHFSCSLTFQSIYNLPFMSDGSIPSSFRLSTALLRQSFTEFKISYGSSSTHLLIIETSAI